LGFLAAGAFVFDFLAAETIVFDFLAAEAFAFDFAAVVLRAILTSLCKPGFDKARRASAPEYHGRISTGFARIARSICRVAPINSMDRKGMTR
jgi:hypothetical protein